MLFARSDKEGGTNEYEKQRTQPNDGGDQDMRARGKKGISLLTSVITSISASTATSIAASIAASIFTIAIAVTTTTLLVFGVLPSTAVAEEARASSNAPQTIEREYRYQDGQELPVIEELITDESGNSYRLVSFDAPIADPTYARPTQSYTRQYTTNIPKDDINNLGYYFAESFYIEDGPFVGNIPPAANPYYIIAIYESFTGQVDRYHTIENLPDNDAIRIPRQMDFTVSSSAGPEATQTATLDLLFIEYEITGTNALGLPNNYTAHLTYRGQESWLELLGYNITAYYEGTIDSNVEQYVIISRYELVVEPVVIAPSVLPANTVTLPALDTALAQAVNPNLAFTVAAIVVVFVFVWLLVWFLLLRRNACLVRMADGNREVLLRRHISVAEGEATFEVLDKIDLYDGAQYAVELKPRLAAQQGELLVTWRNRIVAREGLKTSIQIDMSNIVVDAVIGVISEAPALMAGLTAET